MIERVGRDNPNDGRVYSIKGISSTICSQLPNIVIAVGRENMTNSDNVKQIGNIATHTNRDNPNDGRIYSVDGLSPTLTCKQPYIVVASRGRDSTNPSNRKATNGDYKLEQRLEPNIDNCVNTLTSCSKDSMLVELYELRLRKLTPRECLRLQGVCDEDIDRMTEVNSKTQLYKQAGNSITVNVLEEIFKQMVKIDD